jgi:hypothetical protein
MSLVERISGLFKCSQKSQSAEQNRQLEIEEELAISYAKFPTIEGTIEKGDLVRLKGIGWVCRVTAIYGNYLGFEGPRAYFEDVVEDCELVQKGGRGLLCYRPGVDQ